MSDLQTNQNSQQPLHRLYDDPFRNLESRMNHFFRGMLDSIGMDSDVGAYPVDVEEDDDQIIIEAELPGFQPEEIDLSVEDGILSIKAERNQKEENNNRKKHLSERRYRRIQRSFTLPRSVDGSDVDANLSDGVLTVKLRKSEASKPRRIEVRNQDEDESDKSPV